MFNKTQCSTIRAPRFVFCASWIPRPCWSVQHAAGYLFTTPQTLRLHHWDIARSSTPHQQTLQPLGTWMWEHGDLHYRLSELRYHLPFFISSWCWFLFRGERIRLVFKVFGSTSLEGKIFNSKLADLWLWAVCFVLLVSCWTKGSGAVHCDRCHHRHVQQPHVFFTCKQILHYHRKCKQTTWLLSVLSTVKLMC